MYIASIGIALLIFISGLYVHFRKDKHFLKKCAFYIVIALITGYLLGYIIHGCVNVITKDEYCLEDIKVEKVLTEIKKNQTIYIELGDRESGFNYRSSFRSNSATLAKFYRVYSKKHNIKIKEDLYKKILTTDDAKEMNNILKMLMDYFGRYHG